MNSSYLRLTKHNIDNLEKMLTDQGQPSQRVHKHLTERQLEETVDDHQYQKNIFSIADAVNELERRKLARRNEESMDFTGVEVNLKKAQQKRLKLLTKKIIMNKDRFQMNDKWQATVPYVKKTHKTNQESPHFSGKNTPTSSVTDDSKPKLKVNSKTHDEAISYTNSRNRRPLTKRTSGTSSLNNKIAKVSTHSLLNQASKMPSNTFKIPKPQRTDDPLRREKSNMLEYDDHMMRETPTLPEPEDKLTRHARGSF